MESQSNLAGVPPQEKPNEFAGELIISAEGCGFKVRVDRIAWDSVSPTDRSGKRHVLAFSGVGSGTEVKAVRSALNVNRRVAMRFFQANAGYLSRDTNLENDPDGYVTVAKTIGYRVYHLVAVCRRPGFLPVANEQALWNHLRKETTTPMCRSWLPALAEEMLIDKQMVRPAVAGPMNPALVLADDEYLDDLVVRLLRKGKVRIEKGQ